MKCNSSKHKVRLTNSISILIICHGPIIIRKRYPILLLLFPSTVWRSGKIKTNIFRETHYFISSFLFQYSRLSYTFIIDFIKHSPDYFLDLIKFLSTSRVCCYIIYHFIFIYYLIFYPCSWRQTYISLKFFSQPKNFILLFLYIYFCKSSKLILLSYIKNYSSIYKANTRTVFSKR